MMMQLRPRLLAGLCIGLTFVMSTAGGEEKKEPVKIEEGKPFPVKIELPATSIDKLLPDKKDAKSLSLSDFKGKKNVVLFFYPKAMTKGCTKESCAFRDRLEDLGKYDTVVIGISTDKVDDQAKFTEKEKLNFPLFADSDKKITKALGILSERGMAQRVTYIIDKDGILLKVYKVSDAEGHPEEVLKYVKEHFGK